MMIQITTLFGRVWMLLLIIEMVHFCLSENRLPSIPMGTMAITWYNNSYGSPIYTYIIIYIYIQWHWGIPYNLVISHCPRVRCVSLACPACPEAWDWATWLQRERLVVSLFKYVYIVYIYYTYIYICINVYVYILYIIWNIPIGLFGMKNSPGIRSFRGARPWDVLDEVESTGRELAMTGLPVGASGKLIP